MKSNYEISLKNVLLHEGGYVDHPKDPGGATNKGITYRTYNAWRKKHGKPLMDVRHISDEEVEAIYKQDYWDAVKGDQLPSGIDIVMMDFAVNSGPSRAIKFAQELVGVKIDGVMGPKTLHALRHTRASKFIKLYCKKRLDWLNGLRTWETFKKGWKRRVKGVEALALSVVKSTPETQPPKASSLIQAVIDFISKLLGKKT